MSTMATVFFGGANCTSSSLRDKLLTWLVGTTNGAEVDCKLFKYQGKNGPIFYLMHTAHVHLEWLAKWKKIQEYCSILSVPWLVTNCQVLMKENVLFNTGKEWKKYSEDKKWSLLSIFCVPYHTDNIHSICVEYWTYGQTNPIYFVGISRNFHSRFHIGSRGTMMITCLVLFHVLLLKWEHVVQEVLKEWQTVVDVCRAEECWIVTVTKGSYCVGYRILSMQSL